MVTLLLAGCAAKPVVVPPHHTHRPIVEADPMVSDARQASAEAVRRALNGEVAPEQVDRMTDLTVAMQRSVALAKRHPTRGNRTAARAAIKRLKDAVAGK